jgi:Fungal specific transcription factor domain
LLPRFRPRFTERLGVDYPPSQLVGATDEDKRAFDFFLLETVPMLSGYFDADFWNHFLLQFSHQYPAIWHSVLALSTFHEQRLLQDDRPMQEFDLGYRRYALQNYNRAVSHLRGRLSNGKVPTEIVLASCVVFIAIETLLGNLPEAASHISGGIKVSFDPFSIAPLCLRRHSSCLGDILGASTPRLPQELCFSTCEP